MNKRVIVVLYWPVIWTPERKDISFLKRTINKTSKKESSVWINRQIGNIFLESRLSGETCLCYETEEIASLDDFGLRNLSIFCLIDCFDGSNWVRLVKLKFQTTRVNLNQGSSSEWKETWQYIKSFFRITTIGHRHPNTHTRVHTLCINELEENNFSCYKRYRNIGHL